MSKSRYPPIQVENVNDTHFEIQSPPTWAKMSSPPSASPSSATSYFSSPMSWKSTTLREHHFARPSRRRPQISITSSDGSSYNLAARSLRKPMLELRAGDSKDGPALGHLTFAESHNNFRVHCLIGAGSKRGPSEHTGQVRARVGYPHPSAFQLSLPATDTQRALDVVWKIRAGRATTPGSVEYDLVVESTNASLATLSRDSRGASLRWDFEPQSQEEEVFLVLCAVGVLARMDMKGKGTMDDWPSLTNRWAAAWYYAVVGTALVGAS
ncbi:hypothetical protein MBLNU230_g2442t1 [Neophaeotheca triangularis]